MTCSSQPVLSSMHDILFHVIFGHDADTILEFLHASAARLQYIVQCQYLASTMEVVMQRKLPLDTLKALFFLFLNVDMVLKKYVCDTGSKHAFAEAMNTEANAEGLNKLHAWSMVGTRPISRDKARTFFVALHDKVVKKWLQDERKNPRDLLEAVRDEYLVS